jgi:hypothetical protein
VGIIAVVVVGVVLRALVPLSVWGRARWRRIETRAAAHQGSGTTPAASVEAES